MEQSEDPETNIKDRKSCRYSLILWKRICITDEGQILNQPKISL